MELIYMSKNYVKVYMKKTVQYIPTFNTAFIRVLELFVLNFIFSSYHVITYNGQ